MLPLLLEIDQLAIVTAFFTKVNIFMWEKILVYIVWYLPYDASL